MRRAVILATLTVLLLAVAGVTAARENTFTAAPQDEDRMESAAPDATMPESTASEAPAIETTAPEDLEELDEATVVEPEEPEEPVQEEPAPEKSGGVRDDDRNREAVEPPGRSEEAGKPDKPGKPEKAKGGNKSGKPHGVGRQAGKGKPDDVGRPDAAGRSEERGAGGNPGKVTLCHKGKVTISVGAPAEPAHMRHGDSPGAC